MLYAAFTQPLQDGSLRCLALIPERIVHIAALLILCRQSRCLAQISLLSEHDHEFSLLSIGGVFDHPRRDLARHGAPVRRTTLRVDGARRADRS